MDPVGRATTSLWSVSPVSAADAWIVGVGGTLLHWDGSHWSQVTNPTDQNLYSVAMVSATEGWAVGQNGAILRYTQVDRRYLPLVFRQ